MSYVLVSKGFDSPEITFGANLMKGEFIIDIGKSNKMFRVERPGADIRSFYRQSEHLSDYIRTVVCNKGQSVWIAQRNGRTKDGEDRTDPGLIKMIAMSGSRDRVQALADLHIVPVSISYEWEPCDLLKAVELYKTAQGPYRKQPGEDLNSILTGVLQQKGRIHLSFCEALSEADLRPFESLAPGTFCREVASLIDRRICSSYHLFPNNYIACDLLQGGPAYAPYYSGEEKRRFEACLSELVARAAVADKEQIRCLLLHIYANPVISKKAFAK